MKKYIVRATEKNYGYAVIRARSSEEAEDKALEVYNAGNFFWKDAVLSEFCAEEENVE